MPDKKEGNVMNTVKEMLEIKSRDMWSTGPSKSVFEAIEVMAEKQVGALTVLDDEDRLVGIVSERDNTRKLILKDRSAHDTRVADIMTKDVITVTAETTSDKCMSVMSLKNIRHLPVLDGDSLVGMISVHDLLRFIVRQQLMRIEELQNYIMDEEGGSG